MTREAGAFSAELEDGRRRRREEVGPRRVDCAREGCANETGERDPWFVHRSQVRCTEVQYAGDCAACATRGRACEAYLTPKAALIADEPEIPDEDARPEPTPASIPSDRGVTVSDSHATTSPPNFHGDSHPTEGTG